MVAPQPAQEDLPDELDEDGVVRRPHELLPELWVVEDQLPKCRPI